MNTSQVSLSDVNINYHFILIIFETLTFGTFGYIWLSKNEEFMHHHVKTQSEETRKPQQNQCYEHLTQQWLEEKKEESKWIIRSGRILSSMIKHL